MSRADSVARIANQLLGDIEAVDNTNFDGPSRDQQKLQLILDAFERVGILAIGERQLNLEHFERLLEAHCRCGEYETCSICIEQHRQFRNGLYGNAPQ